MKRITTLLVMVACFAAYATATAPKNGARQPRYRLVWKDNFKGRTFDSRSWTKIPRKDVADWRRHMSDADSLYSVRGGKLILRGAANGNPEDTARYVTGGLYTKHKRTIRHGKVEVKAKLGCAKGAWPAIWMKPDDDTVLWPWGGEIDIMEHLNHDSIAYQTVHSYYTVKLGKGNDPKHGMTHPIDPDGYNIYAVEILPDSLVFSVNGDRYFTYPRINTSLEGQWPFDREYYLLIDMQIEGSWVGKADPRQLPVEMMVDWVKFYELKE